MNDLITITMIQAEFDALYQVLNDARAQAEAYGEIDRFDLIGYLVKRLEGKLPDPEPNR